jgi:hypothetical protein
MRPSRLALPALLAALAAAPLRPAALDRFEIQVYGPDIGEPGQLGLELHSNYTISGAKTPAYPGEIPPDGTARFTLEPALGVTSWLELGAYLQLLVAPDQGAQFGGTKVRAKMVSRGWLPPAWFLGVNVELGRVPVAVEQDQWANEIRPFVGWRNRWLLLDLNPIVGMALSGQDKFRVDLEPAAKIAFNTQLGFEIGAEYYAELGFVDAIKPLSEQAHYLFGVVDLAAPAGAGQSSWELNVAIGGGVTPGADQGWIVKTIIGRSF